MDEEKIATKKFRDRKVKSVLEDISWTIYDLMQECETLEEVKSIFKELTSDVHTTASDKIRSFEAFKEENVISIWNVLEH